MGLAAVMVLNASCSGTSASGQTGPRGREASADGPLDLKSLLMEAEGMGVAMSTLEYKFRCNILVVGEAAYREYMDEFIKSTEEKMKDFKNFLASYISWISKLDDMFENEACESNSGAFPYAITMRAENIRRAHNRIGKIADETLKDTTAAANKVIGKVLELFNKACFKNADSHRDEVGGELAKLFDVQAEYFKVCKDLPARIVLLVHTGGTRDYTNTDVLRTLLNFVFALNTMTRNFRKCVGVVEEKIAILLKLAEAYVANSHHKAGSCDLQRGQDEVDRLRRNLALGENLKKHVGKFPETLEKIWNALERYDIKAGLPSGPEKQ